MFWFTLLQHFVTLAGWQGDALYLNASSSSSMDAEGWVSLDDLFAGQEFWQNDYWQRQAAFSAALLEDMGFLKRQETDSTVRYRATFRAYVFILKWPGLDTYKSGNGGIG